MNGAIHASLGPIGGAMNPPDDDDLFAHLFNRKTLLQRRRELRHHGTAAEEVL
jgi:hypothetical protein